MRRRSLIIVVHWLAHLIYKESPTLVMTTLWLGGGVKQNPSLYGASVAVYGELINADNNPSIGKYGVDYQQEIKWSNKTNSWNSVRSIFITY
jgi:hypothetical protein